jgi:hypothetical protein
VHGAEDAYEGLLGFRGVKDPALIRGATTDPARRALVVGRESKCRNDAGALVSIHVNASIPDSLRDECG